MISGRDSPPGRKDELPRSLRDNDAYIRRLDLQFGLKMGRMGHSKHFSKKNECIYYQHFTKSMRAASSGHEEKLFQIRTAGKIYTGPSKPASALFPFALR